MCWVAWRAPLVSGPDSTLAPGTGLALSGLLWVGGVGGDWGPGRGGVSHSVRGAAIEPGSPRGQRGVRAWVREEKGAGEPGARERSGGGRPCAFGREAPRRDKRGV